MDLSQPFLAGRGPTTAPTNATCLHCGQSYAEGDSFVYLSGGAMRINQSTGESVSDTNDLEAFFDVGVHPIRNFPENPTGTTIIKDLAGGQFDLHYCSLKCLKNWWIELIDSLS